MSTKAKMLLIWVLAGVMLAIGAMYISKENIAKQVESFPDHSEIPNQ